MSIGFGDNEVVRMTNGKHQGSDSTLRIASLIAKCSLSLLIADNKGDPHFSGLCQSNVRATQGLGSKPTSVRYAQRCITRQRGLCVSPAPPCSCIHH